MGMCEKAGIQKLHLLLSTSLCFSRSGCHKTINLRKSVVSADYKVPYKVPILCHHPKQSSSVIALLRFFILFPVQ